MRTSAAFDPVEQLPREALRSLQADRLRATFGLSLDSLAEAAFTYKAALRETYPFGLLRVPVSSLARVHASSGTHGKPTVVGYTPADLDAWTELMARCMTMAGVRPGMLIHNANTYGLFTGGHGFHQGAERIGCPVLPVSGGFTARRCHTALPAISDVMPFQRQRHSSSSACNSKASVAPSS